MPNDTPGTRKIGQTSTASRPAASPGARGSTPGSGAESSDSASSGENTQEARGLAEQVRGRATNALSQQKERATQSLGTFVDAIRSTGRQLGDNNQSAVAGYVNQAADSLQRWGNTLQNKEIGEIVEDVQRFGRRQPALLIGLSFGVGLLGARFLKSSGSGDRDFPYQSARPTYPGASRGPADLP
jgi:hypothetical protein